MKKRSESIKIAVRLRPLLIPYEDEEIWAVNETDNCIYTVQSSASSQSDISESSLNSMKERDIRRRYAETLGHQSISFDHVYGPDSRTADIYQVNGRPIIQSVLNGYHGSIFMYGQTTSGKTYTMIGTPELPGVLPCAIKHIFQSIESDRENEYNVWVSYLEIYNEQINDLLVPGSNNLQVKEDPKKGAFIPKLKQQQVWNFDQVIILMNYGEEHRAYRETNIHEHSSRSHTIFKVYIESKNKANSRLRYSCLNLIDLAGSERLNEFEMRGTEQMEETGHINKSLFILANVVNKLAEGKQNYIPYRDSKLTRILRHALGGNSRSTIICTISPAAMNYHLTLSTLRFATRAKIVQNKPQVNEVIDESMVTNQLKDEILRLREELSKTQDALHTSGYETQEIKAQLQVAQESNAAIAQQMNRLKYERDEAHERILTLQEKVNGEQDSFVHHEIIEEKNMLANQLEQERALRASMQGESGGLPRSIKSLLESVVHHAGSEKQVCNAETERIQEFYRIEMDKLEQQCRDMILESARNQVPDAVDAIMANNTTQPIPEEPDSIPVQDIVDMIDGNMVFKDLDFDFSIIIDEYIKSPSASSDYADLIINKIKNHHDDVNLMADDRLEQSRSSLESYFREQLSETSGNSPFNLTEQHNAKLKNLRNSYEEFLDDLETAYVEALRQFEECLSINEYQDSNHEEPRTNEYQESKISEASEGEHMYGLRPISEEMDIAAFLWGSGKDGRCGHGSEDGIKTPLGITFDPQNLISIKSLACGYHHSAAISDKGILYTWGRGVFGQLGHYNNESYNTPVKVNSLYQIPVIQVACGWQHTAALTQDGKMFTWGYGEDGQLGHGDANDYIVPKKIESLDNIVINSIACGHSHTGCISGGTLYMWGCNPDCRLFSPNTDTQLAPMQVKTESKVWVLSLGVSHSGLITDKGEVIMAGLGQEGQLGMHCESYSHHHKLLFFNDRKPAASIKCGDCYTLVLESNGHLYSFGKGTHGRLGLGNDLNTYEPTLIQELVPEKIVSISAGCRHAGAVTANGQLYMWGFNFYDQLGLEEGERDMDRPCIIQGLSNVKQVACGYFHSGALVEQEM